MVPIIFLYVHNKGLITIEEIIAPIIIGSSAVLILQIILSFVIESKEKRGIIITILITIFFTFGTVHEAFRDLTGIVKYKYILAIYGVIFFLFAFFILRTKRNLYIIHKILNVISISLIIINLFQITFNLDIKRNLFTAIKEEDSLKNIADKPDIYYIILDGYANSAVLNEFYSYNNSYFENFFIEKGFYVTAQSRSNYPETLLSLNSSLNMNYISAKNKPFDGSLYRSLQNNKVMKLLNDIGYKIINVSSNGYISNLNEADLNINEGSILTNEFYTILFELTMLKILSKYIDFEELYRSRILNTFSKLGNLKRELKNNKEPIFVFAHIILPHPPYVFGPNGESVKGGLSLFWWGNSEKEMNLFKDQVTFVNKKMMNVIDNILSNAGNNSIIIVQSDHGPRHSHFVDNSKYSTRMKIFNAFLLPKHRKNIFYDSITPVNTFRIIFNNFFDTNFNLLEDKNYYPEVEDPHTFLNVTNKVNSITETSLSSTDK